MSAPGPLLLKSIFLNKIWAAPELVKPWSLFWSVPAYTGEIWLASDQEYVTPIAEGILKGIGLDEIILRWPNWILGRTKFKKFPIAIKILNVGDWLSVQVHPDDDVAKRLEGKNWGKNEVWLILEAFVEAEIIIGFKPGVNRLAIKRALASNSLSNLLARIPARIGDTFYLKAGTVHAIGPGLVIFEIQQSSHITYRLYDWGRVDHNKLQLRKLHKKKALEVIAISNPVGPQLPQILTNYSNQVELLAQDLHFAFLKVTIKYAYKLYWGGRLPRIVFIKQGNGRLISKTNEFKTIDIITGQTWLVPAGLNGVEILPSSLDLIIFECVGLNSVPSIYTSYKSNKFISGRIDEG